MENYGVCSYGYLSSIQSLTNAALDALRPYYSSSRRSQEEHELEIASFVALRALGEYAQLSDMAVALGGSSTADRLERMYSIMLDHRLRLERMAEILSSRLRDCGEECTDLW